MPAKLWLGPALLLVTACSSTSNINRFKEFAELGRAYEGAVVQVVAQAEESNLDANSQELINARELQTGAEARQQNILAMNESVFETTLVYANLKRQANLLSDYFTALGALASFDGDSAIGDSAGNLVGALQALSPALEEATIGGAAPADLASGVTTLVVSGIRSRRLSAELQRHGAIIDRQLALQSELLEALAADISEDQMILSERRVLDDVIAPYAAAGNLPAGWSQRRRELMLQRSRAAAPAEEAAALSRRLRLAFTALVEGRMEPGDLADYANDLGRLMTLIEQIRNED